MSTDFTFMRVITLPHYAGPDLPLQPALPGDAGADLHAAVDVVLLPGERVVVPTGLKVAIPEGCEGQVRPRSGHAAKQGLTVTNAPGTIDAAYRGEILVILQNTMPAVSADDFLHLLDALNATPEVMRFTVDSSRRRWLQQSAERTIRFKKGDKIAQLVIAEFVRPVVRVVDDLSGTLRGDAGFGSTGV